ncbi:MAG: chromosome segregation ATPase [Spirulinaceae cyanobacterium SM2_1_0]|nr:chromosome segregation ATPase [Spirulinaceae cyanobacterium SM2_1_0]
MRLYCAQLAANKRSEADLLEAIALVQNLPTDHPLYEEIERNLSQWVDQLLEIGEERFHEGELNEAIALASKVAGRTADPQLVEERIQQWRQIWAEGEEIEDQARQEMRNSKWGQAFQTAARLTKLDNRYWATVRYDALYEEVSLARSESRKLDSAFAAMERGNLDSLLEAIELAKAIPAESTAYGEAQTLMREAGDRLMQLAMDALEQNNWQTLANIASRLPKSLGMEERAADLNVLANAGLSARFGTVSGINGAIAEAQRLNPGRPLYAEAQALIARWRLEQEAVTVLEQAENLASYGNVSSLTAAIAQARSVPTSNPRYADAQRKINDWTNQVQLIEDQPFLDRAVELSRGGGVAAWQQAIDQARAVESGSPLYSEAQARIQEWSDDIQAEADRDLLSRADALATAGNTRQAIDAAGAITSGRPLYTEAQARIRRWQNQVSAEDNLQRAYQVGSSGTVDALTQAIALAQQVPADSSFNSQARQAVEGWSGRLLTLAQQRSRVNLREAVAIARRIPTNTDVYRVAGGQIDIWERTLAASE